VLERTRPPNPVGGGGSRRQRGVRWASAGKWSPNCGRRAEAGHTVQQTRPLGRTLAATTPKARRPGFISKVRLRVAREDATINYPVRAGCVYIWAFAQQKGTCLGLTRGNPSVCPMAPSMIVARLTRTRTIELFYVCRVIRLRNFEWAQLLYLSR
jgi:hypothetical protein